MSERLKEIRERLKLFEATPTEMVFRGHVAGDFAHLLGHIDELERENERLKKDADGWGRSADAYMEDNKRLRAGVWEFLREAYPDGTDHPADRDAAELERLVKRTS